MIDPKQDRELQRALLNHPAYQRNGVDPLWRWIAIVLMAIVVVLVAAMAAKGSEVTGGKVASDRFERKNLQRETCTVSTNQILITERFLDTLERVESGRDAGAVGDQGRSLGSYQFKAVAWAQVNKLRSFRGKVEGYRLGRAVEPYSSATNRAVARVYAREYLGWLEGYLTKALKRRPSGGELYAVWNLGPSGFRKRGYEVGRCPAWVRKAAERFQEEGSK